MYNYNTNLKQQARINRNEPTHGELAFWQIVRNKNFMNLKFIRQFPYGSYIFDFYCPKLKLFIEIDGITHKEQKVHKKDKAKENFAVENGFTILRFSDYEVIGNTNQVESKLSDVVKKLLPGSDE